MEQKNRDQVKTFLDSESLDQQEADLYVRYPHLKEKLEKKAEELDQDSLFDSLNFDLPSEFVKPVENMTFEDQLSIEKALLQAQGDETEGSGVDSDVDIGEEEQKTRRLYNYVKVQDRVKLPPQIEEDEGKKTLFIEFESVMCFTYIPDENTGYMANPANIDPEEQMFDPSQGLKGLNVWYYPRPHLDEFLNYCSKNFEPILYTRGEKKYADFVLEKIDPMRTTFRHRLYQNACYHLQKNDEDLNEFIKDVTQFDRDPSQVLLLDSSPLNFILNPDNVIPCIPYMAEKTYESSEDTFLLALMEELSEFKKEEDVRVMSKEKFDVQQTLKNSKLI